METTKNNKLDAINSFLAINNLSNNNTSNLYKKEVLQMYKSEKSARSDLRDKQEKLSKHLLMVSITKDEIKIKDAKKMLIEFYKFCLLDKSKFSNRKKETSEFIEIEKAYNLIKNDL